MVYLFNWMNTKRKDERDGKISKSNKICSNTKCFFFLDYVQYRTIRISSKCICSLPWYYINTLIITCISHALFCFFHHQGLCSSCRNRFQKSIYITFHLSLMFLLSCNIYEDVNLYLRAYIYTYQMIYIFILNHWYTIIWMNLYDV